MASARAKTRLEAAVAEDEELRRLLGEVQRRELDPLTAVREIMERVFRVNDMATTTGPTLAEIQEARERLEGVARETPVISSETLGRLSGRPVWLKAENLQRTGSFKIRGAFNRIANLTDAERAAGVVTASAGNHGQAVAWAARESGVHATVFMPEDAPTAKIEATKSYGADVVLAGRGFDEAAAAAQERVEAGETYVHAFEDTLVLAGQGTLGLELAEQLGPEVETVVVPIGGGGLAAGIALALGRAAAGAAHRRRPAGGVRPFAGLAPTGSTIADGIAVKHPGELTRSLLEGRLEAIVTVTDAEIAGAILLVSERCKLTVEGAGAASVAALLAGKVAGRRRGLRAPLRREHRREHADRGAPPRPHARRPLPRRAHARDDRPGNLADLLALVAEGRANVLGVDHHREGMDLPVTGTEIELTLVMRDEEHCDELLAQLGEQGYTVERLR